MPLYEFLCKQCNHKFDKFVPVKKYSAKCPQCGGQGQKLISLPGALIVDGNFSLTGRIDRRLGDTPITGRKDYHKRVKEKGFRELDSRELKDLVDDDSKREVQTVNI